MSEMLNTPNGPIVWIKDSGRHRYNKIKSIAEWPELRYKIWNGITLCLFCHKWFHWEYGTKNNTYEQFCEFYLDFHN